MNYFPAYLDLKGKACLVVGGGSIAGHKVDSLLAAQANVLVVAPELCTHLAAMVAERRISWLASYFRPELLDDTVLVIAATNEREINTVVAEHARSRALPVNVVDAPDLCSFIMPAVIDRDPIIISIGSSGDAPVLARQIKAKVERLLPTGIGRLADWAGHLRQRVKVTLNSVDLRRRFWETVFHGPIAEQVLAGDLESANHAFEMALKNADRSLIGHGHVSLIGAGPGDPELLTLKAARRLQEADVVLYDALVSEPIMALVRKEAERIFVGKQCNRHAMPQEQINALLLSLAQQGKRVVRLKGGDPFIFGRGAEELELLKAHNIVFEVVPGITSAQGASCYAGIPLTHRDCAHGVSFITGHGQNAEAAQDWRSLAISKNTLVFYMGIGNARLISDELIGHGRSTDTAVVIIERATTPQQRVIRTTLVQLAGAIERHQVVTPALIMVGEVVKAYGQYRWFPGSADIIDDEVQPKSSPAPLPKLSVV